MQLGCEAGWVTDSHSGLWPRTVAKKEAIRQDGTKRNERKRNVDGRRVLSRV